MTERICYYGEAQRLQSYSAYGLNIHSALPLPAPVAGDGGPDVIVRFGGLGGLPAEASGADRYLHATSEGVYLSYHNVGAFLVRDGREIVVDPTPGVGEQVLRVFVLGVAFAVLLHQRGNTVLHASVVSMSGQAVAFVGVNGGGKSTIAATLHARGHDLVADDTLAVDMTQGCPRALSGFPQLKLWPDSVASLGQSPETLPRLHPELEKRSYRITTGFARMPVPLRCIYVLGLGTEPEIEPLPSQDAWRALLPHWYGARFGMQLLQSLGLSTHFLQCVNLAARTHVSRLKAPDSLSALPNVAHLVEEHLASVLQPGTSIPIAHADSEGRAESTTALAS